MKTHHLLVDFNNEGKLYKISIKGLKADILRYLYSVSSDVRYIKATKKLHRSEQGVRKIPCGIVVACSFTTDKLDLFCNFTTKYADERHRKLRKRRKANAKQG